MLKITTAGATMTSREIAELVESRHDHVKVSIDRLAKAGAIEVPAVRDVKNDNNQTVEVYLIGKRDSYVVVAQLSPQFTARLVDRWQELEAGVALPQSFAAALRLAADQQDVIAAQAQQLAAAAPAVEFVERYADSTGLKGFRQVAKLLGAKENVFREFLLDEKVLYRLGGEMAPFAQHLDAGRFAVKAGTAETGHAFNSAKFTPKGVAWVAGEFAKWQLKQKEGVPA
jgi:phage antirepressor YoqD-like protein